MSAPVQKVSAGVLFATIGLIPCIASAQSPAPDRGSALEEIVVTAERREQSLQGAAIAVTALTSQTLIDRGVTGISDLTELVPALQAADGAGPYASLSMRGVASTSPNTFQDAAIAVNMDGVYLPRQTSVQGLFYDLQRVEVLKGPQGTLYGRNATGGAINVISRVPMLAEFGGDVGIEGGNFGLVNATGAVNIPLGSKSAMRIAAQVVNRDGYFSDGGSDEDRTSGRLSFLFEPNDKLSAIIRADHTHIGGNGTGSTAYCLGGLPVTPAGNPNTPGKTCTPTGQFYGDPWTGVSQQAPAIYPPVLPIWTNNDPIPDAFVPAKPLTTQTYLDMDLSTVSAQIDAHLGQGTLTIIPAYRSEDSEYLSAIGFEIHEKNKTEQTTFEIRFASDAERRASYVVGAFYLDDQHKGSAEYDGQGLLGPPTAVVLPPAPNTQAQHTDNTGSSWAVFGQARFSLTDTFRLVAGARHTYEEKETRSDDGAVPFYSPVPGATPPPGPAVVGPNGYLRSPPVGGIEVFFTTAGKMDWDKTNWKAGIEWDISDHSLFYANASTGFKSGGFFFSPLPGIQNITYKPEEVTAYTVGSKNSFRDNSVRLNIEVFHWDYKDQQVSALAFIPPFIIFPNQNAEKATIQGVEIEYQQSLAKRTVLSADLQFVDANYDKYTLISATPQTQCRTISAGPPLTLDCSGNPFLQTPERVFNLGIEHAFPLGNGGEIRANFTTRYESERLAGYSPFQKVDGYTRSNLSLNYTSSKRSWSLGAFVDNIEDTVVIQNVAQAVNFIPGLYTATLRPPRTYGLRFGISF